MTPADYALRTGNQRATPAATDFGAEYATLGHRPRSDSVRAVGASVLVDPAAVDAVYSFGRGRVDRCQRCVHLFSVRATDSEIGT